MQDKINRFQQLSQQHQMVSAQLQQIQQQVAEAKTALEGLVGLEEGAAVYRSAGALMIQVKDTDALKTEMDDRVEDLEVKVKSYTKHEESLRTTVEELRNELSTALGQAPGGVEES